MTIPRNEHGNKDMCTYGGGQEYNSVQFFVLPTMEQGARTTQRVRSNVPPCSNPATTYPHHETVGQQTVLY